MVGGEKGKESERGGWGREKEKELDGEIGYCGFKFPKIKKKSRVEI